MGDTVVLEYKRVLTDLSTGRIYVRDLSTGTVMSERKFFDLEFPQMLRLFASYLARSPDAAGVWQRTDREGLVPYTLDSQVIDLFRKDPVAAIASMCPPRKTASPSTIVRRVQDERAAPRVAISIRAGYDVLADAFGEEVFSKTRARQNGFVHVECPCCGIWNPIQLTCNDTTAGTSLCMNTRCKAFDKPIALRAQNGRWAAFKTADLLATASPRFYLPRSWNDGRCWVTWAVLNEKYNEFEKEKESWSCPAHPVE